MRIDLICYCGNDSVLKVPYSLEVTPPSIVSVSANYCMQERGCINETNYPYSIISPPILVAKPNQQKGGDVISSEYGTYVTGNRTVLGQNILLTRAGENSA